jgi:hypothetical protein
MEGTKEERKNRMTQQEREGEKTEERKHITLCHRVAMTRWPCAKKQLSALLKKKCNS